MFNLEYIRRAETFFALQVPVYYYVKTKGSLCTQGISVSKTIRMKLTVFEYYNQFYKSVLNEEDYEKQRLKIYRFLIDAAEDGTIPPMAKRLGSERVRIFPVALEGRGFLFDSFRERKLLDYYLEPAALKNGLSLSEARLLLYLRQTAPCTRRELGDFTGLARSGLTMLLNRLEGKGLAFITEISPSEEKKGGEKRLEITFPPSAGPALEDLANAWEDFSAARLSGFTPEERERYEALSERIQENIRSLLQ